MGAENVLDYVGEKMKEILIWLEDFWGNFIDWVDKVFPPDTRGKQLHHWLSVALPFLIAGLVLFMCVCCCRCCCRGPRGGRPVRMMKAPGRGYKMPRNVFESNPRSYFRNLHANPPRSLV